MTRQILSAVLGDRSLERGGGGFCRGGSSGGLKPEGGLVECKSDPGPDFLADSSYICATSPIQNGIPGERADRFGIRVQRSNQRQKRG
jgi:hypothetical protein